MCKSINTKKRLPTLITIFSLLCGMLACLPSAAHASAVDANRFAPGTSLVAVDQEAAGKDLDTAGADVTWLDLGSSRVGSWGSSTGADGAFALNLFWWNAGENYGSTDHFRLVIDTDGKVLFRADYDSISNFSEGYATVVRYFRSEEELASIAEAEAKGIHLLPVPPAMLYGVVDKSGHEIVAPGTWSSINAFHEGMAAVSKYTAEVDGEYICGYVDTTGANVIKPLYSRAADFSEGLAAVRDVGSGKWGYIDKTGTVMIPFEYDRAAPFKEGLAYVAQGEKAGYIDPQNKMALTLPGGPNPAIDINNPTGDEFSFYGGLAVSYDHGSKSWGYIGKDGNFAIAPEYAEAEPFVDDAAWVGVANPAYPHWASFLMTRDGEIQTPAWMYSRFSYMEDGENDGIFTVCPFSSSNIRGAINSHGAEIVPMRFDYVSSFTQGRALVFVNKGEEYAVGILKAPEGYADMRGGALIRASVDGKQLRFMDAAPIIENGRVLVPLRAVFEALGAEVLWDDAAKTVTAEKGGMSIRLKIGDVAAEANGATVKLDAPARIDKARTLVPIRFVAESFGADVQWDEGTRTVVITTGGRL